MKIKNNSANNKKIDESGQLLPDFSPEKSEFFSLLEMDDPRAIAEWLVKNGHIKNHCPIRIIEAES
jgi:hypothetical protein